MPPSPPKKAVGHAVVKKGKKGLGLPSLLRKTKTTHASRLIPFSKRTQIATPSKAEANPPPVQTIEAGSQREEKISDLTNPNFKSREDPPMHEIQAQQQQSGGDGATNASTVHADLSSLSNSTSAVSHVQRQAKEVAASHLLSSSQRVPNVNSKNKQTMDLGSNLQITSPSPVSLDRVNIQQQTQSLLLQSNNNNKNMRNNNNNNNISLQLERTSDITTAALNVDMMAVLSPKTDAATAKPDPSPQKRSKRQYYSPISNKKNIHIRPALQHMPFSNESLAGDAPSTNNNTNTNSSSNGTNRAAQATDAPADKEEAAALMENADKEEAAAAKAAVSINSNTNNFVIVQSHSATSNFSQKSTPHTVVPGMIVEQVASLDDEQPTVVDGPPPPPPPPPPQNGASPRKLPFQKVKALLHRVQHPLQHHPKHQPPMEPEETSASAMEGQKQQKEEEQDEHRLYDSDEFLQVPGISVSPESRASSTNAAVMSGIAISQSSRSGIREVTSGTLMSQSGRSFSSGGNQSTKEVANTIPGIPVSYSNVEQNSQAQGQPVVVPAAFSLKVDETESHVELEMEEPTTAAAERSHGRQLPSLITGSSSSTANSAKDNLLPAPPRRKPSSPRPEPPTSPAETSVGASEDNGNEEYDENNQSVELAQHPHGSPPARIAGSQDDQSVELNQHHSTSEAAHSHPPSASFSLVQQAESGSHHKQGVSSRSPSPAISRVRAQSPSPAISRSPPLHGGSSKDSAALSNVPNRPASPELAKRSGSGALSLKSNVWLTPPRPRGLEPDADDMPLRDGQRIPQDAPEDVESPVQTAVSVELNKRSSSNDTGAAASINMSANGTHFISSLQRPPLISGTKGYLSIAGSPASGILSTANTSMAASGIMSPANSSVKDDAASHLSVEGIPVESGAHMQQRSVVTSMVESEDAEAKHKASLPLRILLNKSKTQSKDDISVQDGAVESNYYEGDEQEGGSECESDKENGNDEVDHAMDDTHSKSLQKSAQDNVAMKAYIEALARKNAVVATTNPKKRVSTNPFDSSGSSSSWSNKEQQKAAKAVLDKAIPQKPINPFDSTSDEEEEESSESESDNEDAFAAIVSSEKKFPMVAKCSSARKQTDVAKSWSAQARSLPTKSPFDNEEGIPASKQTVSFSQQSRKMASGNTFGQRKGGNHPMKSPFYDSDSDDDDISPPKQPVSFSKAPTVWKPATPPTHNAPSPLVEQKGSQNVLKKAPSESVPSLEKVPPGEIALEDSHPYISGLDHSLPNFPLKEVDADGSVDVSYLDQTREQDTITTHESFGPQQLPMKDRYTVTPSQELLQQKKRVVGFVTQNDGSTSPALADSLTEITMTHLDQKESATACEAFVGGLLRNVCGFNGKKKMPPSVAKSQSDSRSSNDFPDETPRASNGAKLAKMTSDDPVKNHRHFFQEQPVQPLDPEALKQSMESATEELPEDPTGMIPPRSGDSSSNVSSVQRLHKAPFHEKSLLQTQGQLYQSGSESVDESDPQDRYCVISNSPSYMSTKPSQSTSILSKIDTQKPMSFVDRVVYFGKQVADLSPTSKTELEYQVAQLSPKSKNVLQKSIKNAETYKKHSATAPYDCDSSDASGYLAEEEKKEEPTFASGRASAMKPFLDHDVRQDAKDLSAKSVHKVLPVLNHKKLNSQNAVIEPARKSSSESGSVSTSSQSKLKHIITALRTSTSASKASTSRTVDPATTEELKIQLQDFSTVIKDAAKSSLKQAHSSKSPKPVWTQELIDLTGVNSYDDLNDEEVVWLFDLSPKSSTGAVPSPRSDFDSLMEFAARKLGVLSRNEDLTWDRSDSQQQTLAALSHAIQLRNKSSDSESAAGAAQTDENMSDKYIEAVNSSLHHNSEKEQFEVPLVPAQQNGLGTVGYASQSSSSSLQSLNEKQDSALVSEKNETRRPEVIVDDSTDYSVNELYAETPHGYEVVPANGSAEVSDEVSNESAPATSQGGSLDEKDASSEDQVNTASYSLNSASYTALSSKLSTRDHDTFEATFETTDTDGPTDASKASNTNNGNTYADADAANINEEQEELSSNDGMETILEKVKRDLEEMPEKKNSQLVEQQEKSLSSKASKPSSTRKHRKAKRSPPSPASQVSTRRDFLEILFDHTEAILCGGRSGYGGFAQKNRSEKRKAQRKKDTTSLTSPSVVREDPPESLKIEPAISQDNLSDHQTVSKDASDLLGSYIDKSEFKHQAGENIETSSNEEGRVNDDKETTTIVKPSEPEGQIQDLGSFAYPLLPVKDEMSERDRIDLLVAKALAVHDSGILASDSDGQVELNDLYTSIPPERRAPKPEDYFPTIQPTKVHSVTEKPGKICIAPRPEDYLSVKTNSEGSSPKEKQAQATVASPIRNQRAAPTPEVFDVSLPTVVKQSNLPLEGSSRPKEADTTTASQCSNPCSVALSPSSTNKSRDTTLADEKSRYHVDDGSRYDVLVPTQLPSSRAEHASGLSPSSTIKSKLSSPVGDISHYGVPQNKSKQPVSFSTSNLDETLEESKLEAPPMSPANTLSVQKGAHEPEEKLSPSTTMISKQSCISEKHLEVPPLPPSASSKSKKAAGSSSSTSSNRIYVAIKSSETSGTASSKAFSFEGKEVILLTKSPSEGAKFDAPIDLADDTSPNITTEDSKGARPETPIVLFPLEASSTSLKKFKTSIVMSSNASWKSSNGIEVGAHPETPIVITTSNRTNLNILHEQQNVKVLEPSVASFHTNDSSRGRAETPIVIHEPGSNFFSEEPRIIDVSQHEEDVILLSDEQDSTKDQPFSRWENHSDITVGAALKERFHRVDATVLLGKKQTSSKVILENPPHEEEPEAVAKWPTSAEITEATAMGANGNMENFASCELDLALSNTDFDRSNLKKFAVEDQEQETAKFVETAAIEHLLDSTPEKHLEKEESGPQEKIVAMDSSDKSSTNSNTGGTSCTGCKDGLSQEHGSTDLKDEIHTEQNDGSNNQSISFRPLQYQFDFPIDMDSSNSRRQHSSDKAVVEQLSNSPASSKNGDDHDGEHSGSKSSCQSLQSKHSGLSEQPRKHGNHKVENAMSNTSSNQTFYADRNSILQSESQNEKPSEILIRGHLDVETEANDKEERNEVPSSPCYSVFCGSESHFNANDGNSDMAQIVQQARDFVKDLQLDDEKDDDETGSGSNEETTKSVLEMENDRITQMIVAPDTSNDKNRKEKAASTNRCVSSGVIPGPKVILSQTSEEETLLWSHSRKDQERHTSVTDGNSQSEEECQTLDPLSSNSTSQDIDIPSVIHMMKSVLPQASFDQSQQSLFSALSISSASGSGSYPPLPLSEQNLHLQETLSRLEEELSNEGEGDSTSLLLALTRSETETNVSYDENQSCKTDSSNQIDAKDDRPSIHHATQVLSNSAKSKSVSFDASEGSQAIQLQSEFPRSPLLTSLLKRLDRRKSNEIIVHSSSSENTGPLDAEAMYSQYVNVNQERNSVIIDVTALENTDLEYQDSKDNNNDYDRNDRIWEQAAAESQVEVIDMDHLAFARSASKSPWSYHTAASTHDDLADLDRLELARSASNSPQHSEAHKSPVSNNFVDLSHVAAIASETPLESVAHDFQQYISPESKEEDFENTLEFKESSSKSFSFQSTDVNDVDELFERYDNIVKNMVVCNEERLAKAKAKQIALRKMETHPTLTRCGKQRFSLSPTATRRQSSSPVIARSYSLGSLHSKEADTNVSASTSGSQKARDLRLQIENALKNSASIRSSQEKLGIELSSFKLRLQQRRGGRTSSLRSPRIYSAPCSPQAISSDVAASPSSDMAVTDREPPTFTTVSDEVLDSTNIMAVASSSPISRIRNRHSRHLYRETSPSYIANRARFWSTVEASEQEIPKTITMEKYFEEKDANAQTKKELEDDQHLEDNYPEPTLVETADSDSVFDYSDDEDGHKSEVDDEEANRMRQIESILSGLRRDDSLATGKVSSSTNSKFRGK